MYVFGFTFGRVTRSVGPPLSSPRFCARELRVTRSRAWADRGVVRRCAGRREQLLSILWSRWAHKRYRLSVRGSRAFWTRLVWRGVGIYYWLLRPAPLICYSEKTVGPDSSEGLRGWLAGAEPRSSKAGRNLFCVVNPVLRDISNSSPVLEKKKSGAHVARPVLIRLSNRTRKYNIGLDFSEKAGTEISGNLAGRPSEKKASAESTSDARPNAVKLPPGG